MEDYIKVSNKIIKIVNKETIDKKQSFNKLKELNNINHNNKEEYIANVILILDAIVDNNENNEFSNKKIKNIK
jgi:hypothetical protein